MTTEELFGWNGFCVGSCRFAGGAVHPEREDLFGFVSVSPAGRVGTVDWPWSITDPSEPQHGLVQDRRTLHPYLQQRHTMFPHTSERAHTHAQTRHTVGTKVYYKHFTTILYRPHNSSLISLGLVSWKRLHSSRIWRTILDESSQQTIVHWYFCNIFSKLTDNA